LNVIFSYNEDIEISQIVGSILYQCIAASFPIIMCLPTCMPSEIP